MNGATSVLTITLNPALDRTHRVHAISIGASHRVATTHKRAGGKGLNVARVLQQLGTNVTAAGLIAGPTGDQVAREFARSGIPTDFLTLPTGETRNTVAIVDDTGTATLFNEPGPTVAPGFLSNIIDLVSRQAPHHAVVVFAGSLPPGLPDTTYAELVHAARQGGAITVIDSSGAALAQGMQARPDLAKPNLPELLNATGCDTVAGATTSLRQAGARALAVSLGPDGALLDTDAGCWKAPVIEPAEGNATGAGDATVAGIVGGMLAQLPWPDIIARGVAAGTAAVHRPVAGEIDLEVFHRLLAPTRRAVVAIDKTTGAA